MFGWFWLIFEQNKNPLHWPRIVNILTLCYESNNKMKVGVNTSLSEKGCVFVDTLLQHLHRRYVTWSHCWLGICSFRLPCCWGLRVGLQRVQSICCDVWMEWFAFVKHKVDCVASKSKGRDSSFLCTRCFSVVGDSLSHFCQTFAIRLFSSYAVLGNMFSRQRFSQEAKIYYSNAAWWMMETHICLCVHTNTHIYINIHVSKILFSVFYLCAVEFHAFSNYRKRSDATAKLRLTRIHWYSQGF